MITAWRYFGAMEIKTPHIHRSEYKSILRIWSSESRDYEEVLSSGVWCNVGSRSSPRNALFPFWEQSKGKPDKLPTRSRQLVTCSAELCLLSASCLFLASLILGPWRWRRYAPPNHRLKFTGLHVVTSQETVRISNCENTTTVAYMKACSI
jgi:hypothetical protein